MNLKKYIVPIFLCLLPFIYNENSLDPVLSYRFLFFSIVVFIIICFSSKKEIPKDLLRHPIILCLSTLLLTGVVSTIFSNHSINDGIYYNMKQASFIFFLIFLVTELKENFHLIIKSGILFTLVLSSMSALQFFYELNNLDSNFENIAGTMANKNLLASALFLSLSFGVYGVLKIQNIYWKITSYLSLFLALFSIVIVQSKAVYIAFILLIFILIVLEIKSFKRLFLIVIGFSIFSFSSYQILKSFDLATSLKTELKLTEIEKQLSFKKKGSIGSRLHMYSSTKKMILDNPIFGIGPGNWKIFYPKYGLYGTAGESGEKIALRPHSDFLWVMAEKGILSGLIFLLLFVFIFIEAYKSTKNVNPKEKFFYSFLLSTFVGYFFISMVDFPSERITHNVLFSILISFIFSTNYQSLKKSTFVNHKLTWIFLLFFSLSTIYIAFNRHNGEVYTTKVKLLKSKKSWARVLRYVEKAKALGSYELDRSGIPLYWYSGVSKFNLGDLESSFQDFKKAYSLNPYNIHIINDLGTAHELKGNRSEAKSLYKKALYISPRFEDASFNLSSIYYNEQKMEEAFDIILRCNIAKDETKYHDYLKIFIERYLANEFITKSEKEIANRIYQLSNDKKDNFYKILKKAYEYRKSNNIKYKELLIKEYL